MGLCITHPGPRSGPRSAQWQETDRRRRDPGLPVEPDVLVPPAVVDAVHHDGDALDLRLPAPGTDGVEDDRPGHVLLQPAVRSEEHTSELQSLMRISYAVFCL